jgi:hypothetical protein
MIFLNIQGYFLEHKKAPKGLGEWIFQSDLTSNPVWRANISGEYSDARKEALADASRMGFKTIYLMA